MGIEIQMTGRQRLVDQRQAKRYRFRGDATMRRLDSAPALRGCVLDLSERGCLLRLPDLSDLKVDELVDLSISSNAVSFRAVGEVRRCDPDRWRVGISFMNLTRRGEADLLDLIADLETAQQLGRACVQEIRVMRRDVPPPSTDGHDR
jgi:hypothetical protein